MKLLKSAVVLGVAWHVCALSAVAAETAGSEPKSLNPLTVDPDLAIFTGIVFLLLLAVLSMFAWKPLMKGLEQRERSIADMIDEAKQAHEQAAQHLQAYEQKLASAAEEAQNMLAQARRDAAAATDKLLADAREQANRERQRALDDIENAKNSAVRQIADQSAQLAFSLARKLIHKELKPDDHQALIRESLEQFPSEN